MVHWIRTEVLCRMPVFSRPGLARRPHWSLGFPHGGFAAGRSWGLFISPKRPLKWDPSLFPGCHPWQGPFFHPKRPLKCTFGPTLGALWLSVALGPSRGSQSRFFDRRLQRNWGSGIHPRIPRIPRIPRNWVRSRSSDPPFHAQGSQDDVS